MHLAREVEREVDQAAEGEGRVARGERAEAVIEEVGACADARIGEGVRGGIVDSDRGLAAVLEVREREGGGASARV